MKLNEIVKNIKAKSEEIYKNKVYIEEREEELKKELKPIYEKNNKLDEEISKLLKKTVRIEVASVIKVLADRWDCSEDSIRVKADKITGAIFIGEDSRLSRENILRNFEGSKLNIHFANKSGKKSMTVVGKIDCDLMQKDGKTMASQLWVRLPKGQYGAQEVQIECASVENLVIEKKLGDLCVARWNGEVVAITKSGDILLKAVALSEKENKNDVEAEQ